MKAAFGLIILEDLQSPLLPLAKLNLGGFHSALLTADIGFVTDIDLVSVYKRSDNSLTNYTVRVGNSSNPKNNPACPGVHTGS